jgi:hypothetical protein
MLCDYSSTYVQAVILAYTNVDSICMQAPHSKNLGDILIVFFSRHFEIKFYIFWGGGMGGARGSRTRARRSIPCRQLSGQP